MNIIKLTEVHGNAEKRTIYINTFWIRSFNKSPKGVDTRVELHDKSYCFVRETEEQILEILSISKLNPKRW